MIFTGKETALREAEEDPEVEAEMEAEMEVLETMTEEKVDASNVARKVTSKETAEKVEELLKEETTEVEEADQTLVQEAPMTEEEAEAEEEEMIAAMVAEEENMIKIAEAEAQEAIKVAKREIKEIIPTTVETASNLIIEKKSPMRALNSLDHQETRKTTTEAEALAQRGHQAIKMKRRKTTKKTETDSEENTKTRTDPDTPQEEVDHKVATEKTQKWEMTMLVRLMHPRTWIMAWMLSMVIK